MKIFHIAFSLLLLFPPLASAQIDIKGQVIDISTGETLPSAAVILDETYRGTITNSDGFFSITVDSLPVTITVRFLGYHQQHVTVSDPKDLPLTIELSSSVTQMDEIVVTDKDPGLTIMEKVIERKKIWRNSLQSYRVSAYSRQILSNDTSIVSITESSSASYWNVEQGHKEVQVTRDQTTNISSDQNFSGVRYMPNFYDDNVEIAGYNVVGITHPNATSFYTFKLIETQKLESKPLYKIEFTPRKNLQPAFEGTAWVLGRDYALLEVDLKPNDVVDFPPPVQEFDLSYKQQFSNYGGSYWLPVDVRIDGTIQIGMVGFRMPPIQFKQVSTLSDYEINTSIPDSIFNDDRDFIRLQESRADSIPVTIERIPLSEQESDAYANIDSSYTLEQAFKPEGFLARTMDGGDENSRSGPLSAFTNKIPDGLTPTFRYNRMDGFHAGLKFEKGWFDDKTSLTGFGGYSVNSSYWDYGGRLKQELVSIGRTAWNSSIYYGVETKSRYPSSLYNFGMNTFSTLLGDVDYFDYYRIESASAGIGADNLFPRTDVEIIFNHEIHKNFNKNIIEDYSLFGWQDRRRTNPDIDEGKLRSLTFAAAINKQQNTLGVAGRRQLTLEVEWSDEAIGSEFNFVNYRASLDWNIQTFLKRRVFTNTLDIHVSGGFSQGVVPIQKFGTADGSLSRFSPFGSLKTRQSIPYEGTRYWLVVAEHNFRTIPFEMLGLNWFADKGWGIIVFGGAGHTYADRTLHENRFLSNGIHTEAGISLNSIFGIFRIDVAKRLDRSATFIGLSVPRYF